MASPPKYRTFRFLSIYYSPTSFLKIKYLHFYIVFLLLDYVNSMETANQNLMEKIVSLCKRRGFIYPGSEIYGGLAGTWDYGPLGVELKNNIKRKFWQSMVYERNDVVGIDSAILMNPKVWEASGHVKAFVDPLVECKICHERLRADQQDEIGNHEKSHKGQKVSWTKPRQFNLLMYTHLGPVDLAREAMEAISGFGVDQSAKPLETRSLRVISLSDHVNLSRWNCNFT